MDSNTKKDLYCPISNQVFMIPVITNCNHIFNQTQIIEWLKENETCPLCRQEITDISDLPDDNAIFGNLQKLKIEWDDKKYEYADFIKNVYCCADDAEIETRVDRDAEIDDE